jgi:hypothetical protein
MKKLRLLVRSMLNYFHLAGIIELRMTGYLTKKGWYTSYQTKKSIDANEESIPWLTYPFIAFIEDRLNSQLNIFEYGSGDSTLWYAKRVNSIDAVEHHFEWFKYVDSKKTANMNLKHVALDNHGNYARAIQLSGKKYDVVIVDGRTRNQCMVEACASLSSNGVIVLDNSEREKYQEGIAYLKAEGFKQLAFEGMSPVSTDVNVTSLFYKADNCLGL